jgi:hypothetical protein
MSGTAKKSSSLLEQWNYFSFQSSHQMKKEIANSLKDELLDPFSSESLFHYQLIESGLTKSSYSPNFTPEQENGIFQEILSSINVSQKGSMTLLKKNFESAILKRKILPKDCFENFAFQPDKYKKFLFNELCHQAPKHHSLLTLAYHYAGEYQEACAILKGHFINLEMTTLEFILFAEHKFGSFKHPTLFIQDPAIILFVLQFMEKTPNLTKSEQLFHLENFLELAKTETEDTFLKTLLSSFSIHQKKPFLLPIDQLLNLTQIISFFSHIESLCKIFEKQKKQIVVLVSRYLNSIENNELFFEAECFFEVPLIVDLLLVILKELSFDEKKEMIYRFIDELIFDLDENTSPFSKFFERKTKQQEGSSIRTLFTIHGSSATEIQQVLSCFQAFKVLSYKTDAKTQLSLLLEEGKLATKRINLETSLELV